MWRPLVGTLVLAATLFAGCVSESEDPPAGADDDPILHTAPGDTGNASDEESRSRSHLHDYWGGLSEFIVFDEIFETSCTCGSGAPFFRYEPPGGAVFPQGTKWVNLTVAWVDDALATYADPVLWVETAADHEPWMFGPIANGDTVTIEVDETGSDLPHELLSNWAFEVRVVPENDGFLWRNFAEVHLIATAAKGHPITPFPPHPDLWNGATEILLFDVEDGASVVYRGTPDSGNFGFSWLGPYVPGEGIVVPYDAAMVEVVVEYEADAVLPGRMGFHGSDSREFVQPDPTSSSSTSQTHQILMTPGLPDGPYARQSHWVFDLWGDDDYDGWFVGSYRISATVYKDAP